MSNRPGERTSGRRRPLRTRAWWLMRELASFDLDELLRTVADGSERTAADNLRRYIRALEQHQVLARLPRRSDTWRLARDLGPAAPVWRRDADELWDANAKRPL